MPVLEASYKWSLTFWFKIEDGRLIVDCDRCFGRAQIRTLPMLARNCLSRSLVRRICTRRIGAYYAMIEGAEDCLVVENWPLIGNGVSMLCRPAFIQFRSSLVVAKCRIAFNVAVDVDTTVDVA